MKHSEGFLKIVDDAKSRIKEVSVEDTRARIAADPNARLIDVREDNEWDAAHAAGAIHTGKGIIERDIEATVPDKSTELILYCGGGYRRRWQQTYCRTWVTGMSSRWPAAGRRGKIQAPRLNRDCN